jgi:hypothetical protein
VWSWASAADPEVVVKRFISTLMSVAVVTVLMAACSASHPVQAPSASAGPAQTLNPAWATVFDQIRPDGTVTPETALTAFALAFGPLPGVTVPAGNGRPIADGTIALRWLVGSWTKIRADQRAAAIALVPELANLTTSPAAEVIAPTVLRPVALTTPRRSDFFYTQLAQQIATEIAAKVGTPLGIPIQAKVGPTQQTTSGADTGVYTSSGGFSGTPGKCVITVSPAGDAWDGDDVGAMMAHEVWHCFQGAIGGLARFWSPSTPAWVTEGEAEWVGATMYPNAPIDAMFWPNYLNSPTVSLFVRTYTAIGFYAQLATSGTNVWSILLPVVLAKTNAAAFAAANADKDPFLNAWASGYARDAGRGSPWDISGPGVTSDKAAPTPLSVPDGGSAVVQAGAYSTAIYAISDDSAEVLTVATTGHARVSDGSGHDYAITGDGAFCHRASCTCPDPAIAAPNALPGPGLLVGVASGAGGVSGTVEGMSLKDYCNRGVTGSWAGEWFNDNGLAVGAGTMTLVQKGQQVSGSGSVNGKTCVRQVTISGTVSGTAIHLVVHGQRDLTMDGQIAGPTMSGTFAAISCGPPYGPANFSVTVTGTWRATKVT